MNEVEGQLSLYPEPVVPEPTETPAEKSSWYSGLSRRARVGLWAALVGWLIVGLLAFGGWDRIRRAAGPSTEAPSPAADLALVVAGAEPPALPAMALVHRGERSRDVVLLPAGTVVEVPGLGPSSLAGALAAQGPDGLATSVANMLGVKIPRTLVGNAGDVRALVDTLGGAEVNVPETIDVTEGGFQRTLFARGRTTMRGEGFLRFLTFSVPGQNELERLARQNAAWRGVVRRFGARGKGAEAARVLEAWEGDLSGADSRRILVALAADENLNIVTLPVRRVGLTQADLYNVEREELGGVKKALSDVIAVPSTAGRRLRLLVGADGQLGPAAARPLVEAGYVIVLSGRASQHYDVTRVVVAENTDELRQTGRRILGLLGTGRLGLSKAPQSLVDVTLVIGRDWAAAHGFPQAPPPSPRPARRR